MHAVIILFVGVGAETMTAECYLEGLRMELVRLFGLCQFL